MQEQADKRAAEGLENWIGCDTCEQWFDAVALKMQPAQFKLLAEEDSWVCEACESAKENAALDSMEEKRQEMRKVPTVLICKHANRMVDRHTLRSVLLSCRKWSTGAQVLFA